MDYIKLQFKCDSKKRTELESVWRQTGKKPQELQELESADLPDGLTEVYQWFLALNNRRPQSGMGVSPVLFSEMQAYFSLIQVTPLPWEIQILSAFDNTVLGIYQEQQEREQKKSQGK